MKHKFSVSLSLALIMAMLVTSLALADQVINTIDNTVDPALESRTIVVGSSTTIGYYIKNQNTSQGGDPVNQCNVAGGFPATVTLNVPSGVTASPSSLVFTECDVTQFVTFSSSTPNSYTINVQSVSGGRSGGAWDTAPAAFTLVVNPPANTPPNVSVTGVTTDASYEYGSVPAVGCSVVDAEDGNSTFAATLSAISGPLAAFGLGTQTASCSYTDGGGLTASASVTYGIVDTIAPVITFISRTPANGNGWNNGDVTVNWSCSDSGSGVVAASVSQTVSIEGNNQSATGSCEDHAGNTASDTQSGINIDKTAPTASASASPAANSNGWNNTNVTVSFSGSDALSGIDSCSSLVELGSEGAGQSASGSCTDLAGNSASATANGINIDKTAPSVSLVGGPADGGTYYFGFVPAAPTCSASDTLSGLDGFCSVSGYSDGIGTHTVTASATDKAGNSASASASYEVKAWTLGGFYQPVDMNGTWNTVKGGATVPFKFEVFAGSLELTDTAVVKSFVATAVVCPTTGIVADEIEFTTTGGTSLRYDWTAGQFIYNWQTPKKPGFCYKVTMTTQDGSSLFANFKLK